MKDCKYSFDEPARVIRRTDAPVETVYALTFKEGVSNYFKTLFSKENFMRFIKENIPQKEDEVREKIRKSVRAVSFILLVLGLSYFVFYYVGYRERIADFQDWKENIESINEDELFAYEKDRIWDSVKEQYPNVDFPDGMNLKFANLYAVNSDSVGVLNIPEKDMYIPLMQHKTSPTFYLYKDMYGEYNRYGNPYVDYRCDIKEGELSKNTIIYGHNTHDKLGFNILTEYMTLNGYKEAPVITFETLYEKTQWKIFAVMLTNSTSVADRGHLFKYLITDFSSSSEFMTMIKGINERSMIRTDVDVNADDKIITLYTCYQDIFDGGRLVIFGRLLRDGESAEVDVSKAYFNHSARYPQAYYDQLNLTNPYEKLTKPNLAGMPDASTSEENKEETSGVISEKTTSVTGEKTTNNSGSATDNVTGETASSAEENTTKQQNTEQKTEEHGTNVDTPASGEENKTTEKNIPTKETTTKAASTPEKTTGPVKVNETTKKTETAKTTAPAA